jgi:UDP-3-O-[3-hydroxymyristoyl] glucosamine N-acyltransferase
MSASLTAAELAALVEGALVGDGNVRLQSVAPLDAAGPDSLSFLASGKYLDEFHGSRAGAVLCKAEHQAEPRGPTTRIVVADPHRAMLRAVRVLFPELDRRESGIHPTVIIGKGAVLGERVALGPGCVIGDGVTIGDDVMLYPQVVLYPRTVIGNRVIIHAGAKLGVDGFGYVSGKTGHEKIPHVGRVVVGDDVEIGANSTIDRGSVGDTVIGAGTKIDNLVHIGHGCRIGQRCLIMALVGMAGSTTIGDEVILAGQSGMAGHLNVGNRARIAAQAGVIGDVEAGSSVSGFPARPHRDFMRGVAALSRLAKIVDELERMVERVGK